LLVKHQYQHVLVDIECIGLLSEVIGSHSSSGPGVTFLIIPISVEFLLFMQQSEETHSSSSGIGAAFRKPPTSASSSSLGLFFFFRASPLFSLAASIPCRALRSLRNSIKSLRSRLENGMNEYFG
jgi:hypothetical protein